MVDGSFFLGILPSFFIPLVSFLSKVIKQVGELHFQLIDEVFADIVQLHQLIIEGIHLSCSQLLKTHFHRLPISLDLQALRIRGWWVIILVIGCFVLFHFSHTLQFLLDLLFKPTLLDLHHNQWRFHMGKLLCGELVSLGDVEVSHEDIDHAITALFVVVPE